MESATHLRRQIELAEELGSVTGTMKSLAAVTIHQYEHSLHSLHEYVRAVELGLQIVLRGHADLVDQLTAAPPDAPVRVLVLGSERGLCGPINRVIAAEARAHVDALATGPVDVVVSGTRLGAEVEAVGLAPVAVFPGPVSAAGITDLVEDLLVHLDAWRAGVGAGRVVVVHPRTRLGGRQYAPVASPLLPLGRDRLTQLAVSRWPTNQLPAWHGDRGVVVAALARQLVLVDLHRAQAETQVCVHRARLAAMQGAEDAIAERLEQLSTRYHRQRQARITEELLDVIAGYESVGGPDRR
ncbi:MAG TPA: F0F1 ATP synthase subunit gamma [Acidimicrobiales bacterium]|nr:F0F1 ATP synthase subunit gamma [Acidimicrobiales bacterium]